MTSSPAQRTAVKQRPHQENRKVTGSDERARGTSPRARGSRCRLRRGAAVCFNGLLGGLGRESKRGNPLDFSQSVGCDEGPLVEWPRLERDLESTE